MQTVSYLNQILEYLPVPVQQAIRLIPDVHRSRLQEIRLRSNRAVSVTCDGDHLFLTKTGELKGTPEDAIIVGTEALAKSFQAVCSFSVYSHEQDLAEGYITIRGGCRVGISGTVSTQKDGRLTMRYISSMNFRIAASYHGAAEKVWSQVGKQPTGILIAGPVGSGKTTLLRDLCRLMGNCCCTALVDERGELAAMQKGIPAHDVGAQTDILDGYPRAAGILTALRVLSPQIIVCDEISTEQDADAILQAYGCGVHFAATCHAGEQEDVLRRPILSPLLKNGVFRYCVLLGKSGTIRSVRRLVMG